MAGRSFDRRVMLGGALAAAAVRPAESQTFPARPIRLIVGGAAGSTPDVLARLFADRLGPALGGTVIVDNRPGAGGNLATEAMVRSGPDGHTIALATMSQLVFNAYLYRNLTFDPRNDVRPVANLANGAFVLAASARAEFRDIAGAIAAAKAARNRLLVAIGSAGAPQHIATALILRELGMPAELGHHRSGAEAVLTALRGDMPLLVDAPTVIVPHVRAGTLRALAVTGTRREAGLPDVPTMTEAGFAGATIEAWIGLSAPSGTPQTLVERISGAAQSVLADATFAERLGAIGFQRKSGRTAEFAAEIAAAHTLWGAVIRDAKIVLE
jgi:tripartite-type tricarboxylate transporter receptor subunit TctC